MTIKPYLFIFVMLITGCTTTTTDDVGDNSEQGSVVFPAVQEFFVTANEDYSIELDVDMDWTLSADVQWIKFKDFQDSLYTTISGEKGVISVTFTISDLGLEFEESTGVISIEMDGQESDLATVIRSGKEYEVVFGGESEPLLFGLSESLDGFSCQLTFTANFDYLITGLPDWISQDGLITEGDANVEYSATLTTLYEHYLDQEQMEATINIVCSSNYNANKQLTVVAPGAKGLMVLCSGGADQLFSFDCDGVAYDSYELDFVIEATAQIRAIGQGEFVDWVSLEQSKSYSDIEYNSLLTHCYREVIVEPETQAEERSATLFALPASVCDLYQEPSDFTAEEAEKYIVGYVHQEGIGGNDPNLELNDKEEEDKDKEEEDKEEEVVTPDENDEVGDSVDQGVEENKDENVDTDKEEESDEELLDEDEPAATLSKMESSHHYYQTLIDSYNVDSNSIYLLTLNGETTEQITLPFKFNDDTDQIITTYTTATSQSWLSVRAVGETLTIAATSSAEAEGYILLRCAGVDTLIIYCDTSL